jgi:hypothetical protein
MKANIKMLLLTKPQTRADWLLSQNRWQLRIIRKEGPGAAVQAQSHQVAINGTQYLRERQLCMAHTQCNLGERDSGTKYGDCSKGLLSAL